MSYWKQMTIRKLEEYIAMCQSVSILTSAIRGCRVRGRQALQRRLDVLSRKTELQRQLKFAKEQVDAVEKALRLLTEEEYMVVEMLYMNPGKGHVERLCQELHCEQATIFRRRDRALEKIALALAGKG